MYHYLKAFLEYFISGKKVTGRRVRVKMVINT